ncbi:hypothetical protein SAMN05444371_0013 [Epilithonimonas mollis]|uniref:Uncharacterized protein n=2 Tax=Epilithonimonas mollis TaxID=216903 RepID=A0A1M6MWY4_9FLAO|nr:hypothetical protein SAMN05444371_0013 [Epilithonimonas mollis]
MSKYALIFFTLIIVPKCFGQIKRKIKYRDKVYEIYVQNNRMKNSTQIIPGMKVFIIIGASSDLDSIYNSDKLKNIPITGMNDYAIFYYLKTEQITETNDFLAFFKNMIEELYQEDFFDRNRVHLICRSFSREFLCQESYELSKIFSTITIQGENETSGCKNLFLNNEEIW